MMALKHSNDPLTLAWLLQDLVPVSAEMDREILDIKLDSREVQDLRFHLQQNGNNRRNNRETSHSQIDDLFHDRVRIRE